MAGDGGWSVEPRPQRRCSGGDGPLRSLEVDRQPGLQLPVLPWAGDENVGLLALATTDLLTVATEHADHRGVATIPTMGTEDEGFPALTDDDLPTAGTAVVTLWGPVVLPTTPCRRLVAPIACSGIHLVLEPNRTAS